LAMYGPFGAAREHAVMLATQGAGVAMLVAAAIGIVVLARRDPEVAAWLLSFPAIFFLFISNAWPFGRLENPLFPFLTVLAAVGIDRVSRLTRRPVILAVVLTAACAAQPLALSIRMDRLFATTDTRTLAKRWIETHVPAGTGVAVQAYSVPLEPTREWLAATLAARLGDVTRASYRFRAMLARDPYPAPAYRVYVLGAGGLDPDKVFRDPAVLVAPNGLERLRDEGVSIVVLKRFAVPEEDPLRDRVARFGRLLVTVSPYREGSPTGQAVLPDYDVRPDRGVDRPGPVIEVWELKPSAS
jgi:hypothetical protein